MEHEQRHRDELRENVALAEKRCSQLQVEKEELMTAMDSSER